MIPKVPRCTMDMLSQVLYDKTKDGGKTSELGSSPSSPPHCGKKPNKN
jgi:hypothetical protein